VRFDLICSHPRSNRTSLPDSNSTTLTVYQWRKFFSRVEPFYAVKCNPDPVIVKTLALMGTNFDCASRGEIELVHSLCAGLPRMPEIIYANPCKANNHLKFAVSQGVRMVTFDNASEIAKCAKVSKEIQLILRIATDDRGSQCRLSSKFGAPEYQWRPLLQAAKQHSMAVIGVSFHVGSGCRDASRYELALKDARKIFDMGKRDFGFDMKVLDIGGGFPVRWVDAVSPFLLCLCAHSVKLYRFVPYVAGRDAFHVESRNDGRRGK
jgi:ornithine decarboxylase